MSGSGEWDNRVMDSLKNFDLSSPEVKQQFGKFVLESILLYEGYCICSGNSSGIDEFV